MNLEDYTKLNHRFMLETDIEDIFETYKHNLPIIFEFLQDNNEIKGYSLDNCAALGSKKDGFVKGRIAFKLDRYIDIGRVISSLQDQAGGYLHLSQDQDQDQEGENTNDRK
tara:strand:+ start:79 stop:411 length:333 start_codon:yes stop_codon:yes gene_type:complete